MPSPPAAVSTSQTLYADQVNPQWVRLLGRRYNLPKVVAALKNELDWQGPALLQNRAPELAGGCFWSEALGLARRVVNN